MPITKGENEEWGSEFGWSRRSVEVELSVCQWRGNCSRQSSAPIPVRANLNLALRPALTSTSNLFSAKGYQTLFHSFTRSPKFTNTFTKSLLHNGTHSEQDARLCLQAALVAAVCYGIRSMVSESGRISEAWVEVSGDSLLHETIFTAWTIFWSRESQIWWPTPWRNGDRAAGSEATAAKGSIRSRFPVTKSLSGSLVKTIDYICGIHARY